MTGQARDEEEEDINCVHLLQHLNNHIDITNIQIKGFIFSRPPAMYDV